MFLPVIDLLKEYARPLAALVSIAAIAYTFYKKRISERTPPLKDFNKFVKDRNEVDRLIRDFINSKIDSHVVFDLILDMSNTFDHYMDKNGIEIRYLPLLFFKELSSNHISAEDYFKRLQEHDKSIESQYKASMTIHERNGDIANNLIKKSVYHVAIASLNYALINSVNPIYIEILENLKNNRKISINDINSRIDKAISEHKEFFNGFLARHKEDDLSLQQYRYEIGLYG